MKNYCKNDLIKGHSDCNIKKPLIPHPPKSTQSPFNQSLSPKTKISQSIQL